MNVYILVEGNQTETIVFPYWINYINPNLKRKYFISDVTNNDYYLISGSGIPSIYNHAVNAIKDINENKNFDLLIISLDSEDYASGERRNELLEFIESKDIRLIESCRLEIIVQNICIESWFLGNKKIVKANPQSELLNKFLTYYNVREEDPEKMNIIDGYKNKANFHLSYFKEVLKERNISYSKSRPKHVQELKFFNELLKRTIETNHIPSFNNFCNVIESTK
ncbi:hypothetical protein ACTS9C_05505 [Empedobacter brevis]